MYLVLEDIRFQIAWPLIQSSRKLLDGKNVQRHLNRRANY